MRNRCGYAGLVSAYFSVYLARTKNVSTNTIEVTPKTLRQYSEVKLVQAAERDVAVCELQAASPLRFALILRLL